MTRRTPALTKQVRDIFEEHYMEHGTKLWSGDDVFAETGLTPEQIRDAIWGPAADVWRRGVVSRRRFKIARPR